MKTNKDINILNRQIIDRYNQPYKNFIKIHLEELKYMTPWAQYENKFNYKSNRSKIQLNEEIIDTHFYRDKTKS